METLVHADVFFAVAAIAVGVLVALLAVMSVYVIRILRDVRHISNEVKGEVSRITSDIDNVRTRVMRRITRGKK